MNELLAQNREIIVFTAFCALILGPIVLGVVSKKISAQILTKVVLPLFATSFLFYMGMKLLKHQLDPFMQLIVFVCFGLFWMIVALYLLISKNKSKKIIFLHLEPFRRKLAWLFLGFGGLWIMISVYRYFSQAN